MPDYVVDRQRYGLRVSPFTVLAEITGTIETLQQADVRVGRDFEYGESP